MSNKYEGRLFTDILADLKRDLEGGRLVGRDEPAYIAAVDWAQSTLRQIEDSVALASIPRHIISAKEFSWDQSGAMRVREIPQEEYKYWGNSIPQQLAAMKIAHQLSDVTAEVYAAPVEDDCDRISDITKALCK